MNILLVLRLFFFDIYKKFVENTPKNIDVGDFKISKNGEGTLCCFYLRKKIL
jgi:hypothetical protein